MGRWTRRAREGSSDAGHSSRKLTELESEVARLQASLEESRREVQRTLERNEELQSHVSSGGVRNDEGLNRSLSAAQASNEQLKRENAGLTQRLHELDDKFQLLLGRIESTHEDGGERARDSMAYGSITSELDKWERDRTLGESDGGAQPSRAPRRMLPRPRPDAGMTFFDTMTLMTFE